MVYSFIYYTGGGVELNRIHYTKIIEYVYEIPKDSSSRYEETCDWLYENFKKDKKAVLKNQLTYLNSTLEVLNSEIKALNENKSDPLKFFKLKQIEFKENKENFEEFLEEIKYEYEFLNKNTKDKNDYEYFNRLFSWYKLKPEFLESAINFLSNNELDVSNLDFEFIILDEYKKKILEIE